MRKAKDLAGGIALFLAGVAAGVLSAKARLLETEAPPAGPGEETAPGAESAAGPPQWEGAMGELEGRLAARQTVASQRIDRLEARAEEQSARLAETPNSTHIESRLAAQEAATAARLEEVAARLDEHRARLDEQAARLNEQAARLDALSAQLAEAPAAEQIEARLSAQIESRLAAQEAASAERLNEITARLDEHTAKLAEVPTTPQLVSAMEQLLAKTMTSLDDRLATQARSIEVLTTTVSQTDNLLEKVLESLDTLQPAAVPPGTQAPPPAPPQSVQRAAEMPQSVRSSVEYLLGRPLGPEEEFSIAAVPRR